MRQYHNSVIENEVKQGILDIRGNTKNTCLAFLREIKNFNIHDTRGGKTLISQKIEMIEKRKYMIIVGKDILEYKHTILSRR